jgi:ribosome-interacting GTPase 1
MPANLPPQYLAAEQRFREARTIPEKIEALEEMFALLPKHKGTDHLKADIRRRIAKLKVEGEKKGGARRGFGYHVDKQGAGQVVLVGPPNAGKSRLLSRLTNAKPGVAEFPFTTTRPQAGMIEYENVQIQLVDLPPIAPDLTEPWVAGIIRAADAVLLVADLEDDAVLERTEETLAYLDRARITLVPPGSPTESPEIGRLVKRALLGANKADIQGAGDRLGILAEAYGTRLPVLPLSAHDGRNLEEVKRRLFEALGVLRVYTKAPGKPPSLEAPVVLPSGSTVLDVAASIHKDFAQQLKFARIWGTGKFDGQKVQRDFPVREGDVIEFHV